MALRLLNTRQLAATQLAATAAAAVFRPIQRHLSSGDQPIVDTDNNNKPTTSTTSSSNNNQEHSSATAASSTSSTGNGNNSTTTTTTITKSIFVNKKVIKQQYVKYSMSAAVSSSAAPSATVVVDRRYEPHIFPTPNNTVDLQEKKSSPAVHSRKTSSPGSHSSSSRLAAESRERLNYIKSFYADPEIDKACEKQFIRLNPMTMMYMGVSNDNSHLLKSANYLRNELPIRLAYMIKELRNLPFIIACNPSLLEIHERCVKTFREFNSFDREIKDLQSEREFNQIVHNMLELNKDLLVMLCDGFKESRRYIRNEAFIKNNLNKILSARLGIRLLSEHHIALNKQSNLGKIFVSDELNDDYADEATTTTNTSRRDHDHHSNSSGESSSSSNSGGGSSSYGRGDENWHGIIHRKFSPKKLIENSTRLVTRLCKEKYGASPKIKIDGHTNAQFPYLPLPLEYIMPELLKNAFRATYEQHQHSSSLPDVNVTIAVNDKDFVIRIRDRGGGIPHDLVNKIFDYHFTTAYDVKSESNENNSNSSSQNSGDDGNNNTESDANSGSSTSDNNNNASLNIFLDNSAMGMICEASSTRGLAVMHGYGFGLPTSRAYAEYLGGSLTCQSMQGIGSDFYLRLGLLDVEPEVVRI